MKKLEGIEAISDKYSKMNENENATQGEIVEDGIFLYFQQRFRKFFYKDILFIKAEGSYCKVLFTGRKEVTFVCVLCHLYEKLPKDMFVRIHRSYVVNIYAVTGFCHKVIYIEEKAIHVGDPYRDGIMQRLNYVSLKKNPAKQDESFNKLDDECEKQSLKG